MYIKKHVQKQRNKEEEHVRVDNSLNVRSTGIAAAHWDLILFQTRVVHVMLGEGFFFLQRFASLYINC